MLFFLSNFIYISVEWCTVAVAAATAATDAVRVSLFIFSSYPHHFVLYLYFLCKYYMRFNWIRWCTIENYRNVVLLFLCRFYYIRVRRYYHLTLAFVFRDYCIRFMVILYVLLMRFFLSLSLPCRFFLHSHAQSVSRCERVCVSRLSSICHLTSATRLSDTFSSHLLNRQSDFVFSVLVFFLR